MGSLGKDPNLDVRSQEDYEEGWRTTDLCVLVRMAEVLDLDVMVGDLSVVAIVG